MNKHIKKLTRGQSLFESLVAVSVVSLVLIALTSLTVSAISATTFAKNQNLASRYTMEALEWLRQERDANWTQFASHASSGTGRTTCLQRLNWSNGGSCGTTEIMPDTPFRREVILILNAANNEIEVTVSTMWSDSSGDHDTRATTVLSDWQGK